MLVVPEVTIVRFQTELSDILTSPGHIIAILRSTRFAVHLVDQKGPIKV